MTTALGTDKSKGAARITPASALKAASRLWFAVAVIGQWAFVYFIVGFYYSPTLQGHFEAWNRKDLITGYVAGDQAGNLFFAVHVVVAAIITTSGALQLIPQIRARAPTFHRWNGRLYLTAAFLMALDGLWLTWVRGTYLALVGAISGSILALLIMTCAVMTLRSVLAGRMEAHHRWALRLFLVVSGVWFQRVGYMAWIILNKGPVGIGDRMNGPFDYVLGFAEYLLPLTVLEIYLRTQARGGPMAKAAVAASLLALTAVMAVGIGGTYMIMWRPLL